MNEIKLNYEDGIRDGFLQALSILKEKILTDPTRGATGDTARGYRDAINDIKAEVDLMIRKHNEF